MNEEKFKELMSNIPYWVDKTLTSDKDSVKLGYAFMHEGKAYGLDVQITISKIGNEKG